MKDAPLPPPDIALISYADDCTAITTGSDIAAMSEALNSYLATLHGWFKAKNLTLSWEKSTATIFTTWTKETRLQLDIRIDGNQLPTVQKPKLLGVTFDNLLTFSAHAKSIADRLKSKNNILKAIAGTTWGKSKETLVTAYKTICRPVANYAAPISTPHLSKTQWENLQTTQNAALRTATGCLAITNVDHHHWETQTT